MCPPSPHCHAGPGFSLSAALLSTTGNYLFTFTSPYFHLASSIFHGLCPLFPSSWWQRTLIFPSLLAVHPLLALLPLSGLTRAERMPPMLILFQSAPVCPAPHSVRHLSGTPALHTHSGVRHLPCTHSRVRHLPGAHTAACTQWNQYTCLAHPHCGVRTSQASQARDLVLIVCM